MPPRANHQPSAVAGAPFDPHDEWTALPEYRQRDLRSAYRLTVHFTSDADAEAFFQLIDRPRRRSIWWPAKPPARKGLNVQVAWIAADPAQAA